MSLLFCTFICLLTWFAIKKPYLVPYYSSIVICFYIFAAVAQSSLGSDARNFWAILLLIVMPSLWCLGLYRILQQEIVIASHKQKMKEIDEGK